MAERHNCPCSSSCELEKALNKIGGKWKMRIICSLMVNGDQRYNELLKNIAPISNTMLTKTLNELADDHLIERTVYPEVPVRVEYSLSEKSRRLAPILQELIRWSMTE